jgi:DNA-binding NtrC family response regulator
MPAALPLLIVSAKAGHKSDLSAALARCGLKPVFCETSSSAGELLRCQKFSVVFCEDILADGDFRSVLREVDRARRGTPVIVVSPGDDWDSYLRSLRARAFDCVTLPAGFGEIERALHARSVNRDIWNSDNRGHGFEENPHGRTIWNKAM